MEPRADPAWDSFWRYDRLSSFHAAPGAPNYGSPVADGWRALFDILPNSARLLDLATGNGAIAVLAVAAGRQFAVTGADLAAVEPTAFVTQNREELAQITFLASTPAEALPLPDASMDAIVSQYGVEYSDLSRSLPEVARVLAPGGRLRFACHAAEGSIARDTATSIADADFLLGLDLVALSGRGTDEFNAGLKAIADRAPAATDVAMLANVHHSLCDTFDHRHGDLVTTATHLVDEITAHRDRQTALLAAARTFAQMKDIGAALETLGLTALGYGEQRDGANLIGHVIEARRA
ncbi:MAG: class I SAM-dependent methyltransferase [Sphingomicrobium sp.]